MTTKTLTTMAPAKVNLTLDVLGRRPDGYHALKSVMQTLELADQLDATPADTLLFTCDDESLSGDDNLVLIAARKLRELSGTKQGAHLHLVKRIPAAAGLGGGSSDAAATLWLLNQLWKLYWPRERLIDLAAAVGSDVPFFLWGGTALIEGRGEIVAPLPPLPDHWLVLLPGPAMPEKTKRVFGSLIPDEYSNGTATDWLVAELAFGNGNPTMFGNSMTAAAERAFPLLTSYRTAFEAAGANNVLLSGAGPTLFAATPKQAEAAGWHAALEAAGYSPILTRTQRRP